MKKLSFFNMDDLFSCKEKVKRIRTNWIVLTGTGSTGKSTLVEALKLEADNGISFIHVDEEFRHHLKTIRVERKMTTDEYNKYLVSQEAFDVALKMRLDIERKLDPNSCCVLDRSLIDTLAYGIEFGSKLSDKQHIEVKEHLTKFRYKEVYHLGLIPLEDDSYRLLNTEQERIKSQSIFVTQYARAGYLPIQLGKLTNDKMESIRLRVQIVAEGTQTPLQKIKLTPSI